MKKKYSLFYNFKRINCDILREGKSIYLFFALFTVCAAVLPYFGILLPKLVIGVLEKENPNEFNEVLKLLIKFGVPFLFIGFMTFLTKSIASRKITRVRLNRLSDLTRIVMQCDYKYIEDTKFLDENENAFDAVGGNNTGYEGSMHILFALFATILSVIGYIIIIAKLNVFILLFLIFNIIISYFLLNSVKKFQHNKKQEIAHSTRRLNYYNQTTHDFAYGKDIRLNNMEDNIIKRYDVELHTFIGIFKKIFNKQYKISFIDLLLVLIREGLVYSYLIYSVIERNMTIADFTMYFTTISLLSTHFTEIINKVAEYTGNNLYIGDLYKFLDMDLYNNGGEKEADLFSTKKIELKNLTFKYPNTTKYILKDINLTIEKGEKLAIVGVNGAGKTTLIKLLCGFFDSYEGEILLDGVEIKEFKKSELYKIFSIVFQNVKTYAMSIKENVALDYENIDEEKVLDSLKKVGLIDKVNSFKKGMNQSLLKVIDPEGVELSGGENQKIAIARALYKDAPIIILDEPTASLDALAEEEIYYNFNTLIQDKTAIYISHRLSSTKFCDKIILLGEESILEYGTHDELLSKKGKYYDMFMIQAKYYQDGEYNE